MDNGKIEILQSAGDSRPEIHSGRKSFAFEPVVGHEIFVPDNILTSNFRAEMDPEVREKLRHLSGRGALISGFAGVGKTSLISYLAKNDGASIISVEKDNSEGVMSAKFCEARELAGSGKRVYVVFDEIDEFGSKEALFADVPKISTLLRELDGLKSDNSGNLYFFATTNNLSKVDPRLLRPGRLEELVEVPLPTTEQKEKIIGVLLDGVVYSEDIAQYMGLIARKSRGYSIGIK